jgi:hypothetical protein
MTALAPRSAVKSACADAGQFPASRRARPGGCTSAMLTPRFARLLISPAERGGGTSCSAIEDIDPGRSRREHVDSHHRDLALARAQSGTAENSSSSRLRLPLCAAAGAAEGGRPRLSLLLHPLAIAAEIADSPAAPHGPDGAKSTTVLHCRRWGEERAKGRRRAACLAAGCAAGERGGRRPLLARGRARCRRSRRFGDVVLAARMRRSATTLPSPSTTPRKVTHRARPRTLRRDPRPPPAPGAARLPTPTYHTMPPHRADGQRSPSARAPHSPAARGHSIRRAPGDLRTGNPGGYSLAAPR